MKPTIHPDPKEYRRAYMSKRWHNDPEYRRNKYLRDRANLLRKREREARELDKLRGVIGNETKGKNILKAIN